MPTPHAVRVGVRVLDEAIRALHALSHVVDMCPVAGVFRGGHPVRALFFAGDVCPGPSHICTGTFRRYPLVEGVATAATVYIVYLMRFDPDYKLTYGCGSMP